MSDVGPEKWTLRAPVEPPANLAATLVERLDLAPPIDIDGLADNYADVFEEAWPYKDCDAVVVGLISGRPTIFLRAGLLTNRRRFTLAHELGHVLMGWHVGVVGCLLTVSQFEVEPLQPVRDRESIISTRRLNEQEAEATRFASYLLIPDRFLRPLVGTSNMELILNGLNQAKVSAAAALMRLRQVLQPGFCFAYLHDGKYQQFWSPGTERPPMPNGFDVRLMERSSKDHGSVNLSGRRVCWFRLQDFESLELVDDSRTTAQILHSAIAACESNTARREQLRQSINGVAGGVLSADRAETPGQALAILRHKFGNKPGYGEITTHPDFDLYLRRRAEEWARKKCLI